jgi:hypothetical protein
MQMVKRIIGAFVLILVLLWLLSPKQELYYFLEKKLKENDIVISNETVTDRWYGVDISDADLYVKGINMAKIEKLSFNFFFVYTNLLVKKIKVDKSLRNMAPESIENVDVQWSIIDPLHVKVKGVGSFGTMDGSVALLDRNVKILFPVAKDINSFKKFLRKDPKGGWYYETNY